MTKIVKSRYELPAFRTKSTLDAIRKPTVKTLCSSHTRARKVFQMTEHNTPRSTVLLNLGKRLFVPVIVSNKESSSPESSINHYFASRGNTLICFLCSLTSKAG